MDRVDEPDAVRLQRHEQRRRADAAAEEADAAQEVAVGDASGAEDDVVAGGELGRVVNLVAVDVAHRLEAFLLPFFQRLEAALHASVQAAHRGGGEYALGRAAYAHRGVDAGPAHGGGDAGGEIAVGDQLDARARFADLRDEIVMPFAVEDHDGQFIDVALKRLGDLIQILVYGVVQIDVIGGSRADHDFVHVDVRCVEQAAFFRGGEHRDRIRGTRRAKVRSFERIDGDVDLGINLALGPTAAQRFADVENRRLVAFALADDDCPAHLEPVQLFAHRLDGYLIGVLPFAIAHRARCSDGRFFRDTQKTDLETGFHDAPFAAKFGGADSSRSLSS